MPSFTLNPEEISDLIRGVAELAEELECTSEASAALQLNEKLVRNQSYVTLLGETSTGKSTFANSMIGHDIIPVSSPADTGAVIFVIYSDTANQIQLFLSGQDGSPGQQVTLDEFHAAAKGGSECKRLLVLIPESNGMLAGLTLVDTPGFNSVILEHREVLDSYLVESDVVLFFINYRSGVRPTDLGYFQQVKSLLDDDLATRLFVVVNFAPSDTPDKRVAEIERALKDKGGYEGHLYILASNKGKERTHLSNTGLVNRLRQVALAEDRTNILRRNVLFLVEGILARLGEYIEFRRRIFLTEEQNIGLVVEKIRELGDINETMNLRVGETERLMYDECERIVSRRKQELVEQIDDALKESSRWKDIEGAKTFVANTIVDCGLRELGAEAHVEVNRTMQKLADELDGLAAQAEGSFQFFVSLDIAKPPSGIDERLLGRFSGQLAGRTSRFLLGRLAGAPGDRGVVGVMNLSRKLMGYVNKALKPVMGENVFGREAMRKVGPLLKQFGITTTRVAGVAGAAALDAALFAYKGLTWKKQFREHLLPEVDKHCDYVQDVWHSLIKDCVNTTRTMLVANYTRRIEVLTNALEARRSGRTYSSEQIQAWIEKWDRFIRLCDDSLERPRGGDNNGNKER